MGLKDVLAKMKLVELEAASHPSARPPSRGPAPPASGAPPSSPAPARETAAPRGRAPAAPSPRAPAEETIEDILASLPQAAPKLEPAAVPPPPERPGARDADFTAVYRAARVPDPPHGFTAHALLQMLASPHLATLDPHARAQALLGFLEMNPAGRVSIRDVIEDAVRRDQALDAYEQSLIESFTRREADVAAQNEALQAEIDELARRNRERMRANSEALEAERARVLEWRYAKMQEERRLFDAVAPFVEANPVSIGGVASGPSPGESRT